MRYQLSIGPPEAISGEVEGEKVTIAHRIVGLNEQESAFVLQDLSNPMAVSWNIAFISNGTSVRLPREHFGSDGFKSPDAAVRALEIWLNQQF